MRRLSFQAALTFYDRKHRQSEKGKRRRKKLTDAWDCLAIEQRNTKREHRADRKLVWKTYIHAFDGWVPMRRFHRVREKLRYIHVNIFTLVD
jgi:hypothetical protein